GHRAVGEDRVYPAHIVDHVAVADRAGAAAIVCGHASDCGAVAGRDIDREPQFVLAQLRVEPLHDGARLYPDTPRLGVEFDDPLHIFAALDDERAADRLAALRSTAPARQHRDAFLARDRQRGGDVVLVFGDNDANRLDLIDRGVGAVAAT